MFLDSCLIAEIYEKGHDVAKADTQHRPGELVEVFNILPLLEIYNRLNGERNGECLSDDEDLVILQPAFRVHNNGYQVDNRSVLEKMRFCSWYTSLTHMSEEFGQDPREFGASRVGSLLSDNRCLLTSSGPILE